MAYHQNRHGHHKFGFSQKKSSGSFFPRRVLLSVAVVALILVVPVFVSMQFFNHPPLIEHHGPNSDIELDSLSSGQVLGQESTRATEESQNIPGNPADQQTAEVQNQSQDKSQSQGQDENKTDGQSQSQPVAIASGFGIAAGGGLTELNQEKLNRYFDSLGALGVKWVRWDVDWGVVQRDGTASYNWEGTDRVAQTAKRYGINSLGIITYTPKWARDKSCKADAQCAPVDPATFGRFAGTVALRYRDSITHWEIWNEPNMAYNYRWEKGTNVKKYADVLKNAYTAIKKTNPAAMVLSGGLAPAADNKDSSLSPITFIKSLYASGANQYLDAIALHPYSFPVSPQYGAGWNSWQQMNSIRQFMVKQGDGAKKIWVTEYGAPTGGPGTKRNLDQLKINYDSDYMSEAAQKSMAQGVATLYAKNKDWMGPLFWYSLQDNGTKKDTPENFFGLLRYDGSKKPAYDVFKNAIYSGK